MTAPLKPCPFCGGDGRVRWYRNDGSGEAPNDYDAVSCVNECVTDYVSRVDWNRRAPDRAALVDVARRGCNTFAYGTDSVSDAEVLRAAEEIVTEYLAEQEEK